MGKTGKVDLGSRSGSGLEVYMCSPSYANFLKTFLKHFGHMEFVVDIPNVIILAKPLNHEDVYFIFGE